MATMRFAFVYELGLQSSRWVDDRVPTQPSLAMYCGAKLGWKRKAGGRAYFYRKGRFWDQVAWLGSRSTTIGHSSTQQATGTRRHASRPGPRPRSLTDTLNSEAERYAYDFDLEVMHPPTNRDRSSRSSGMAPTLVEAGGSRGDFTSRLLARFGGPDLGRRITSRDLMRRTLRFGNRVESISTGPPRIRDPGCP